MKRVLITGASGYIGQKLAVFLSGKPEIEEIIGIDVREPSEYPEKFRFYERDVRRPIEDLMRADRVDTVIHAAFILPPLHDIELMEDINVNGTRTVLASSRGAGVSQLLYTSSATAYGFYPDNERPLTEDSPIRGNDDFTYSRTKRIIEGIFKDFVVQNPDMIVTVVRPCFVVGPGFDNPFSTYMQRKLVPVPLKAEPFQLVHEDDLIEIIYQLLVHQKAGAFNVGAEGTISGKEMVSLLGNIPIPIPYTFMYFLNSIAWKLRMSFLTEFPSPALNMIRYPWVVSSEKLKKELGYTYRYNTREAFDDFVKRRCA